MIGVTTLLGYLAGRRGAIFDLAASRSALWLGAAFVLSAALAREYDGESLLHEPWHLLIPFGASLATSFTLFCLLSGIARLRRVPRFPFWRCYRSFLALYWLTAPLAWLYAIPVERFLSAHDAAAANLGLLGLVAAWRVILMIRVVSVFFRATMLAAAAPVLLFADAVVLVLLFHTPLPVISMMGGVRLSEAEQVIQGTALLVGVIGFLALPVWFVGTCCTVGYGNSEWSPMSVETARERRVSWPAWILAATSLTVWATILPFTQAEQQRRWRVERDLREGRISEALAFLSAHERRDFPPHWDPLPRVAYAESGPELLDVLETIAEDGTTGWVRPLYMDKLRAQLQGGSHWFWYGLTEESRERLVSLLESLPEGPQILGEQRERWEHIAPDRDASARDVATVDRLRGLLPTQAQESQRATP